MQVAHFLNAICTPVVQSGTILFAHGKTRLLNTQHKNERRLPHSTSSHLGVSLEARQPYYVDRKDKASTHCHQSCHSYKTCEISNDNINKLAYLRKRKGMESTYNKRTALSKQKRLINQYRQRHTHQPLRQTDQNLCHLFRKQYAEEVIKHKFCHLVGINCCGNEKCKLDCYNAQFQEFLRETDLHLLKGITYAAKRGFNLDSKIKSQIISLFVDQKNSQPIENILSTVQQTIIGNLDKQQAKKFKRWAQQIIEVLSKIQNRKINIEAKTKKQKIFTEASALPAKKLKKAMVAELIRVYKQKSKNKYQKATINKPNIQRQLSVIGSKADSERLQGNASKQYIHINLDANEMDPMGALEAKFKSRIKNRNRLSQSINKRKIKNLNHASSTRRIQPFDDEDGDETAAGPHLNSQIKDKEAENSSNKSQSTNSIEEEKSTEHQDRLNLFEKLLSQGIAMKIKQSKLEDSQLATAEELKQQKSDVDDALYHYHKVRPKMRASRLKKSLHTSAMASPSNVIKSIMKMKTRKLIQIRATEKNKKNIDIIKKQLSKTRTSIVNSSKKQNEIKATTEKRKKQQNDVEAHSVFTEVRENSCLMSKIEEILTYNGLQQLIVKQNDSLLTQKRKIRAIIKNAETNKIQVSSPELQKYFKLFIKKTGGYCLHSRSQHAHSYDNLDQNEQKDYSIEELFMRFNTLKFYQLRTTAHHTEPATTRQIVYAPSLTSVLPNDEAAGDGTRLVLEQEQKTVENQSLLGQRKLLGQLENYVTEKQHTPFDFYHYLQLGNSIAIRKYYKERNEYFKEQDQPCKRAFLQKQLESCGPQSSLVYS